MPPTLKSLQTSPVAWTPAPETKRAHLVITVKAIEPRHRTITTMSSRSHAYLDTRAGTDAALDHPVHQCRFHQWDRSDPADAPNAPEAAARAIAAQESEQRLLLALFARVALLVIWFTTPLVTRAFHGGWIVPLLGVLFLPLTVLTYTVILRLLAV